MRFDLHRLAMSIFNTCIKRRIKLEIQWISRTEMQKADYITWGPHSVDCMANLYNIKIPRFFSRFWNPGTIGVDFFMQNLNSENFLVVPPISLVPRVLHYLSIQKARATLVVPLWPSSSFWPLITSNYGQFIKGHLIEDGAMALTHGINRNSLLGSRYFSGKVVAIKLEFKVSHYSHAKMY